MEPEAWARYQQNESFLGEEKHMVNLASAYFKLQSPTLAYNEETFCGTVSNHCREKGFSDEYFDVFFETLLEELE